MKKNQIFTEGPIVPALITFAIPIIFTKFLQSFYGAADLLIVGRYSDAASVSAVATGSQLMGSITFVIADLALGTTIILGQLIGQKRREECGRVIGATISLFLLIGVVAAVAIQFLAPLLAGWMNAPEEAFEQTVAYVRICGAGAVFIVGYNILGSIFRGIGDSRMPLVSVIIASVFNIAGDLILVKGFGMGAKGAALATVAAQGLSVLLSVLIIRKRGLPFEFRIKDIGFHRAHISRIFSLGVPVALQDVLVSLSFLIITALLNKLGVTASAGVGVAEKLCNLIMLVPNAFEQAMSSFVAQNYGARNMARANKALFWGITISFIFNVILAYVSFFHGVALSGIFSVDPAVCAASADYLKSYSIDCLLTAFLFCFLGYFNGCGKTRFFFLQGLAGAFFVRIPLAVLFSRIEPVSLFRIGLATPASSVVQTTMCIIYFIILSKQLKKEGFR